MNLKKIKINLFWKILLLFWVVLVLIFSFNIFVIQFNSESNHFRRLPPHLHNPCRTCLTQRSPIRTTGNYQRAGLYSLAFTWAEFWHINKPNQHFHLQGYSE